MQRSAQITPQIIIRPAILVAPGAAVVVTVTVTNCAVQVSALVGLPGREVVRLGIGTTGEEVPVQVPKAVWQPIPQNAVVLPQNPAGEQQF